MLRCEQRVQVAFQLSVCGLRAEWCMPLHMELLTDREVCGLGGLGRPAELAFLPPRVVSSCDLRKIHPWLLSQARPGGPRVWCGPLGVRAQAHPAPFLSLALLQPLLFRCFFPPSPMVRPENSLALLRPRCSCAVPGLGHHSSRPTGEGETSVFCPLES